MGLSIGLNGCSLRDEHGLLEMVPAIPEDKIIFETDAPYCEIRSTHPGFKYLTGLTLPTAKKAERFVLGEMVKSRNEPACINQVAAVVAGIRNTDMIQLSTIVKQNTLRLFKKLAR